MMSKVVIIAFVCVAAATAGLPAAYIAPYASTYNAHTVNHAVAAPVFAPAAPVLAPAAKFISPYAAAPFAAAPVVAPAAKLVSPYAAAPYSALPYSLPYSSPLAYSPYAYPGNYLL